jgi:hypothetical protein
MSAGTVVVVDAGAVSVGAVVVAALDVSESVFSDSLLWLPPQAKENIAAAIIHNGIVRERFIVIVFRDLTE